MRLDFGTAPKAYGIKSHTDLDVAGLSGKMDRSQFLRTQSLFRHFTQIESPGAAGSPCGGDGDPRSRPRSCKVGWPMCHTGASRTPLFYSCPGHTWLTAARNQGRASLGQGCRSGRIVLQAEGLVHCTQVRCPSPRCSFWDIKVRFPVECTIQGAH